ncbi:MAG: DUF4403 family protein [Saprospiraceae bacterium]|nr:DUF4403 family protein [Saprospiraceae bacterium]
MTKPMEQYDQLVSEDRVSVVNVPVRINLRELEKSLNSQLSGVLYEDKDLNDGDKMMLRAEKSEDIRLNISGQSITYRVPVKIWVKYNIGITNLEATGEIAMNFKTDFSIDRDWNMQTLTNIERYEWIKQPKLKMGSLNVPVGFIADIVLRQSKSVITKSVDEEVKENFNLREMVEDAWRQMFDPVLVSPEYNTWLLVNPQNIGMTPLVTENEIITSVIFIESRPKVNLGTKPQSLRPIPLPPFVMRDTTQNDFVIHINTDVPFTEAERIAKAELLGETFSEGKRSVKIEDVELYGQGTKLIVNTRLSGSYNGNIYLSGRPFFDAKNNVIDIKDLDFTLETRNFLYKSAAWLLKGTLRKKIEENMNFLLAYNLTEMKKQLQEQLSNYKVAQNIFLDGNLDELYIRDAFLAPESIRVEVAIKGKLNVQVNGLN